LTAIAFSKAHEALIVATMQSTCHGAPYDGARDAAD